MLLKIIIFLIINIFIYTKCNSYILKNNYFENLFFINNINSFNNGKEYKIFRIKKLLLKSNKKRKKESLNNCFLLNRKHCGIFWKYKTRKKNIFLSNFDRVFKESFNEDDKLKKSELISILACICTNIVIEYLKIKEEKKNENFEYSFDYSVMNILKMVNFEYDVNEEIKKSKKKSYKKTKTKKNIPTSKLGKDYFINRGETVYEESEELNINIDNKNSKEENEQLDKYIYKLENNTMEISEIKHYIDLFFGKNTYNNVFVKFNIDINKIYEILNSVLFEKSKEKENVIQLQKFVDEEENKLCKKKIHIRNVNTFSNYLDKFNSLEESKNINEIENILYDDYAPKSFKTEKKKKNSRADKKSKLHKDKNKMNSNLQNIGVNEEDEINDENDEDNQDNDQNNDENDEDNQDNDQNNDENDEDNQYNDQNNDENDEDNQDNDQNNDENDEDNQYNDQNNDENDYDNQDNNYQNSNDEDIRINQNNNYQSNDNRINGINNEDKLKEENNIYEHFNHRNDENKNFSNRNYYEQHEENHENKREFLNSFSYALIKKNNIENDENEEKKEEKNNIILIKFVYDNIYKCEFRTDIGVIVYDSGKHTYTDNIERKMKSVNIDFKYLNKDIINIETFINDVNLEKLSTLPYKKRFYKKQIIIKEINKKINCNNLYNEYLNSLLCIYLKIWGDDLHFYELKKVEIKFFNKEKNELTNNKKCNFLNNYNEKKNILIDSDMYNEIINTNLDKEKYFYKLFDDTFLNNDYISFNLKLFINNKKEINSYNTLMNTLKMYNSSLSKSIQCYLNTIKEHNFSFMSSKEFLKNYIYNENDEFFNMKKILQKCKIESKYFHLFLNSKQERKNKKKFKLFCFYEIPVIKKFCFQRNKKHNIFENKKKNKFLGEVRNYSVLIYAKKKNKNKVAHENVTYDPDDDELEDELTTFENINNILNFQKEKNEVTDNETSINDNKLANEEINKRKGEKNNLNVINSPKNIYIEKMLEKKKKMTDFLNLVELNENVKKDITVVNYEEALKHFKDELRNKQKRKKRTNETNNANSEDESINEMKDEEINKRIQLILENKNGNIIKNKDDEIQINDRLNIEKEKIEDFFKDMNIEVKLSKKTCVGCGIMFQSDYKNKFGFLKNHIYEKVVNTDLDKKILLHDIYNENKDNQDGQINYKNKLDEFFSLTGENINNIFENNKDSNNDEIDINNNREDENSYLYDYNKNSTLTNSYEKEDNDENRYICERCFNLRYKNKIYDNLIVNYTNNNEISVHDFEKYVINIFKKRCFIIYIVDILDLYVYSNLNKLYNIYKKIHYDKSKVEGFYFCVNKIDLLKNYKEFTIKNYIYNFLKGNKINILFKNIFLVSAKTGYNVKKLIYTVYISSRKVFKNKKNNNNEKFVKKNEKNENDMNDLKGEKYNFENLSGSYDEDDKEYNLKDDEHSKDLMKKENVKDYYLKNVNIYIVGNANSGKSSLINYLLKNIKKKGDKNSLISDSIIPGTTLKNIKIKLNKNLTINDTPGIISNHSILSYLNYEELKYVVCTNLKKKIPSMYINENDFIFVGGILYIHILSIKKYYSIISFFISGKIPIIKRKNFSKDANLFLREKIESGFLYPPFSVKRFDEISNFKKHYFNINNTTNSIDNSSYDIHIQGMGYITFYSFHNIEFNLYTLKNVDVVGKNSLMPYHKKYGNLDFSKKML
ncbi:conserved Plasmodium protein, unknown function [Plasmodium relictum]|uniref:G domain-containing protein n=1 Tax=Plasmodium relictum TaxID=85471 RepID=A0A1J1H9H6_PLARL|nr:conserved Plasmodium protein, unknown function [Plasmodium relictum]CRH01572.1 conserved Plasmodium protein, unknown function [Plasmodium relictum]